MAGSNQTILNKLPTNVLDIFNIVSVKVVLLTHEIYNVILL